VARLVQEPGAARDRLTDGIFAPRDAAFRVGLLDQALETCTRADAAAGILRKAEQLGRIRSATGEAALREAVDARILSPEEAATLRRAETLRDEVIRVDSFPDLTPARAAAASRRRSAA
jgi:acyl-CoA dehydrogenase